LLHQADGVLIRSTDENAFSAVGVSSVHDMVAISNLKTEASPPSFIHLGCQSSRFFSESVQVPFYFTKTSSDCAYRCSFLGYSFFAIQTGGKFVDSCLPLLMNGCTWNPILLKKDVLLAPRVAGMSNVCIQLYIKILFWCRELYTTPRRIGRVRCLFHTTARTFKMRLCLRFFL